LKIIVTRIRIRVKFKPYRQLKNASACGDSKYFKDGPVRAPVLDGLVKLRDYSEL
jgi:hypothetical protein